MKISEVANRCPLYFDCSKFSYPIYLGDKLLNKSNGNVLCAINIGSTKLDDARPDGKTARERKYGVDFFPDSQLFATLSTLRKGMLDEFIDRWSECIIPQKIVYTKKGKTPFVWETLFWPLDKERARCDEVYVDEDGIRKKGDRAVCPTYFYRMSVLVEMKGDVEINVQRNTCVLEDYLKNFDRDVTKFLT